MPDEYKDKLLITKYNLAIRKIRSAMSDLYKLAKDNGVTISTNTMNDLNHVIVRASGSYGGYGVHYAEQFIRSFVEKKKVVQMTPLQAASHTSIRSMNSELHDKVSTRQGFKVKTEMLVDKCGVDLKGSDIASITVPVTYHITKKEIGDLSTNKILIFARPYKHDTYKCWRAQYLTWVRSNGYKRFRSVDCFIMKDKISGIVYHHTDYRLCADGMRRAIGRSIAKRIGG